MTERLFESDSHIKLFFAEVLTCEKEKNLYKITLNKTAFFPEGGGQKGDSGYFMSGEKNAEDFFNISEDEKLPKDECVRVFDTLEKDGVVYHICSKELIAGETVTGLLDYDVRFRRMQNHTGEHIVSGIIHKYFGYDNVGFHMGSDDVTLDINGYLDENQLKFVENLANKAVIENVPVRADVYSGDELFSLDYRSKLELVENVRIVTVEGYDKCACCAPHVKSAGEIGIIKLLYAVNYKQGVRIHMLCGFDAIDDYDKKQSELSKGCAMLSAKQGELVTAIQRVLDENKKEKQESNGFKTIIASLMLEKAKSENTNCLFTDINDPIFMRYLATNGSDIFGVFGVFCNVGGESYRYVIVGKDCDMKQFASEMNKELNGRGGGDSELVQGSVKASAEKIKDYFAK